jgi:hypothetical protein
VLLDVPEPLLDDGKTASATSRFEARQLAAQSDVRLDAGALGEVIGARNRNEDQVTYAMVSLSNHATPASFDKLRMA